MDHEKIKNLQQLERKDEYEETDQDDVISLCNLSTDHYEESVHESFHDQDSNEDDSFEFSFDNPLHTHQNVAALAADNNNDDINFCGKIISYNATKQQEVVSTVDDQRCLKKITNSPATGSYGYRYRNYASNSNSRKQYALIGVAKISVEMKLSDIKKRQSRRERSPTLMFPLNSGGELAVAGDNGCGNSGKRSHWGLVRSLRCGAHYACVLAKTAFGCFRLVRVCNYG